jgi:hypothetical protein
MLCCRASNPFKILRTQITIISAGRRLFANISGSSRVFESACLSGMSWEEGSVFKVIYSWDFLYPEANFDETMDFQSYTSGISGLEIMELRNLHKAVVLTST